MSAIRVALSGSGFKFPAHVGALKAILDSGCAPVEIAATSGGSIVASLYAAGMPISAMEYLSLHHDWSDFLSFNPWSLITKMGFCSGNVLQNWLVENTQNKKFSDLSIELSLVASDITYSKPYIFNGRLTPGCAIALAARCSSSIPLVYAAMNYDNRLIMDGGIVNNIPMDLLTDDNLPQIGVQLVSKTSPMKDGVYGVAGIAERVVGMMLESNDNAHVDLGVKDGAHVVFVETGYVGGLDNKMSLTDRQRLLNDGYNQTIAVMEKIK